MARYLVIAYQTAESPELLERLKQIAEAEEGTRFVLLVPATAAEHLRLVTEDVSEALALSAVQRAQRHFQEEGIELSEVRVSDPNPIVAATEELANFSPYDGIVVSTFPPGVSRWLKMDIVSRIQRISSTPVTHVLSRTGTGGG
jgi:predicted transcriptional regulator